MSLVVKIEEKNYGRLCHTIITEQNRSLNSGSAFMIVS